MPNKPTTFLQKMVSALFLFFLFISLLYVQLAMAATTGTTFNQTITEGTLSIEVVDGSGVVVGSPAVSFVSQAFSFDPQDSTGTLGISTEKIRVGNPTTLATWSVSMAATGGPGALWTTGTYTYPHDDTTSIDNGRLTVTPAGATITPIGSGCTNTNVSLQAGGTFINGTLSSVDLFAAASGADTLCRWDLTGVSLSQRIPASQTPGSYSIAMTLTVI